MKFNKLPRRLLPVAVMLLCVGTAGAAQDPEYVLVPGKPVTLNFKDGRVGELVIDRKAPLRLDVLFQVTENNCSPKVDLRCKFHTAIGVNTLTLRWLSHHDPLKVGKSIHLKSKPESPMAFDFELSQPGFYGAADKSKQPKITANFPEEEMECDDYSWMAETGSSVPEKAEIVRWDTEAMQTNPETGLMENRTIGGALKVELTRSGPTRLKIAKVKRYLGSSLTFFFGDLWALVMKTHAGEYCSISLKPNLVGATNDFNKYFAIPPRYVPYLFDEDEYSTVARPFFLGILANELGKYELY